MLTDYRIKTVALLILVLCSMDLAAQKRWISEEVEAYQYLQVEALPIQDNEDLRVLHDFYTGPAAGEPQIFATDIKTHINPSTAGQWEETSTGMMVWRHRISSEDAYSLNLGFTDFYLPESAVLFLSDGDRTNVIGPITSKANNKSNQWWSPIIPGSEVILELQVAPKAVDQVRLHLGKVNHDFSGFGAVLSGSCNLDVICSGEDGYGITDRWRDQINGVGRMIIDGRFNCTGSLVNNTRRDCTPYVVTAEHCGITESTAASVVIYWNFQNSSCRTPDSADSGGQGNGSLIHFNTGSRLVAKYDQTDFVLIELNEIVDINQNPYYQGWDRVTEDVSSAFVIHHPGGDEKRISYDFDSVTFNVDRNYVRVEDWDIGTTEGGSSGAPLFNDDGLVIGYLSGGDAACGNDAYDDFGMFKRSWEGGGTPETRLSDWLDPINTGQSSLVGRYCRDVAVLDKNNVLLCGTGTTDTLTLRVVSGFITETALSSQLPQGVNVSFSMPTIIAGQQAEIYVSVDETFAGPQEIQILLDNVDGQSAVNATIDLDVSVPNTPTLTSPVDQAQGLNFGIPFTWNGEARNYTIEISRQESFSSLFAAETTSNRSITIKNFAPGTTYYWRVRSTNRCGSSSYSDIYRFTTGDIACSTLSSTDIPKPIPLVPETITSTLKVQEDGTVADVNIPEINIQHTYLGDLTISLISPAGTEVVLLETTCEGDDDMRAGFDDESDNINIDCPLTTGRLFRPVTPLSALIGEEVTGTWTLKVVDGVNEDGGQLLGWSIDLCINRAVPRDVSTDPTEINICAKDPSPIMFDVFVNEAWTSPESLYVNTASGVEVFTGAIAIGQTRYPVTLSPTEDIISTDALNVIVRDASGAASVLVPVSKIVDTTQPSQTSPTSNDDAVSPLTLFSWESNDIDARYRLILSTDPNLTDPVIDTIVSALSYQATDQLAELTLHYWQVVSIGICSDAPSEISSFMTDMKVATNDIFLSSLELRNNVTRDLTLVLVPTELTQEKRNYWIYDISGRLISTGRLASTQNNIDVSSYGAGTYFFKAGTPRDFVVKKIVKL